MNIQEAKAEIRHTLQAYFQKDSQGNYCYPRVNQRPILLIGPPGIGKTAIMQQLAQECGVGLVSYTITHHTRQSAVGLPKIVSAEYEGKTMSVTEYTMSEIIAKVYEQMKQTGNREGILFIDEINCVSETLAPTMLQFLQNKTFGNHKVPDGWLIVAAGNPPQYNKSVREFDIVTLDRVRNITITEDYEAWMQYAREQGIHISILTYLQQKQDHFYVIEQKADEKQFVTARGWEDLSRLLYSYESLGIALQKDQILQFLQHRKIAADFSAYYQMYQSCKIDYQLEELLENYPGAEETKPLIRMAEDARFDERLTLIGLLLDGIGSRIQPFAEETDILLQLQDLILQFQKEPKEVADASSFLWEKAEKLEKKEDMGLISQKEAAIQKKAQEMFLVLLTEILAKHIADKEEAFFYLTAKFEEKIKERKEHAEVIQNRIRNAFWFAADAFGKEQEMMLLVNGCMKNPKIASFLAEFGSDAFLDFSSYFLDNTEEENLMRECMEWKEQ